MAFPVRDKYIASPCLAVTKSLKVSRLSDYLTTPGTDPLTPRLGAFSNLSSLIALLVLSSLDDIYITTYRDDIRALISY